MRWFFCTFVIGISITFLSFLIAYFFFPAEEVQSSLLLDDSVWIHDENALGELTTQSFIEDGDNLTLATNISSVPIVLLGFGVSLLSLFFVFLLSGVRFFKEREGWDFGSFLLTK